MSSYVISGASRGLGYAFVKVLAADSSNTVIGLARDKEATERRLAADGISNARILAADITDSSALKSAAQEAAKILDGKGLDVLINNAGYVSATTALRSFKDFEANTEEVINDTQKSIDVNVLGTLKAVFAFLPLIRQGRLKKVVAISSGMGDIDLINEAKLSNAAPYATSKAALSTMFAKLNASYQDEGIIFMSLCAGLVDTAESPESSGLSTDAAEGRMANLEVASDNDLSLLKAINAKFEKYAPGFQAMQPAVAARSCLAAIDRSTLELGLGGSFLSHNGTKRWM